MMRGRLDTLYGEGEAKAMIRIIFTWLMGWKTTDLLINSDREVSESMSSRIADILERLERHEPIQYITGIAPFYGFDLHVDRRVLIPRPETEMLVDLIADIYRDRKDLDVLDIGTGSGAIAIALARNLPFSKVTAIDVSGDAIDVARENAAACSTQVKFIEADLFTFLPPADSFDIVVSNPPYIDVSEKMSMEANVLDYEPHTALFADASDPLKHYRSICLIAAECLRPGGGMFLEINPMYATQIEKLLSVEQWRDVRIINDIHGRRRFAEAYRSNHE